MQYRLRTLLIFLAVLPPLLSWTWIEYARFRTQQQQREALTSFPVPAGSGLRVVVPAAGPASVVPTKESEGQVFSFYSGFSR